MDPVPDLVQDPVRHLVPDPVLCIVPDPVPDMIPDLVLDLDLIPCKRDLQNNAVGNTCLTKVAIANSKYSVL
jgi:hypothetical protein